MILWLLGRPEWFAERIHILSRHHLAVILVTIFVPVGLPAAVGFLPLDCWWVRLLIYLGVLMVWAAGVVVVFSRLVERDARDVNQLVFGKTDPLAERLQGLSERHGGLIEDVRVRVEDLEKRTRETFERMGAEFPPRSVSVSALGVSFSFETSVPTVTLGGRWRNRLRRRFLHIARRVWEVVYGKPKRV